MTDETVYVSPSAPFLSTRITVDGKDVNLKFDHGRLVLKGAVRDAFEAALETSDGLRQYVHKMDRLAAEALVAQHRAQMQGGAVKGAFNTEAYRQLKDAVAPASAAFAAEAAPNNTEAVAELLGIPPTEIANGGVVVAQSDPPLPPVVLDLK